ncbi:hypothetical protein MBLNU230_g2750t1 [Neophaeotheca triangularis]
MLGLASYALAALSASSVANAAWIVPGGRWRDNRGELVNAHAGGITRHEDGRFYWFGEYKIPGQEEGAGVSCYSSEDMVNWTWEDLALEPDEDNWIMSSDDIIQRPKVAYSEVTGQYHMWWHADNSTYGLLLQGLAVSDDITGPYEFVNATQPLGNYSQDFGMFTDYKTGEVYNLFSNGDAVWGRDNYITRYNDAITEAEELVHRFHKFDLEAPAIIQTEESYYIMMSHKTGYRPNNVVAFRADNLEGPWSQPFIVAPLNTRTFNSQSGMAMRFEGTKSTTYLYMGDQWDDVSLWESRYIWLPMAINDTTGTLEVLWYDVYDLNLETGEYTPIEGEPYYAYDGEVTGAARLQEANFASGGLIATNICGNDSTLTLSGIQGQGSEQWVSFYYQNIDDMGFGDQPFGQPDRVGGEWILRRISSVVVNDDWDNVHSLYARDTHKGIILSTPLLLPLQEGDNTITIGGLSNGNGTWSADIDRVVVYPPEPMLDAEANVGAGCCVQPTSEDLEWGSGPE